jgi:hypothetical protein
MKMQLIAGLAAMGLATSIAVAASTKGPRAQAPGPRAELGLSPDRALTPEAWALSAAQPQGRPIAAPITVTLIGCVEFEQDYRKRMAAGRGGVLGSGVGAGDEFVLTNVRPTDSEVGTSGRSGRGGAAAPASPGAGGGVYSLTGPQEKNLKRDVGRQIEVVGVLENAGKESTGAELTDISDLPRIAISTWHPVNDFCPSK